jgi:integrase
MRLEELTQQWLAKQRKRVELGKLKPASLATFTYHSNHILPRLGELEIEAVRNGKVKEFAETLAADLGPKTTREIVATVRRILENHVNDDGEPLLDIKWRNDFIFENVREIGKQKQPTITMDALNDILKNRKVKVRDRVLLALAASTGLRVGELQSIKINGDAESTSWDSAASAFFVRRSVWKGQLQLPKTKSAIRQIDLSKPVNAMLIEFTEGKNPGEFLFATRSGKPLGSKHIDARITTPNGVPGMHSLRRYRASWCDEQGCPRSLLAEWMGHSTSGDTTSTYVKSSENQSYRRQWVERIGTGLEIAAATLPMRAPHGRPDGAAVKSTKDAKKSHLASSRSIAAAKQADEARRAALDMPAGISEAVMPKVVSHFPEPVAPQIDDADLDPMFFEEPKQPGLEELEALRAENERIREVMGVK